MVPEEPWESFPGFHLEDTSRETLICSIFQKRNDRSRYDIGLKAHNDGLGRHGGGKTGKVSFLHPAPFD